MRLPPPSFHAYEYCGKVRCGVVTDILAALCWPRAGVGAAAVPEQERGKEDAPAGVYLADGANPPVFRPVCEPSAKDLQGLVEQIAARVGRVAVLRDFIERDIENAWLSSECEAGPLDDLIGHSITYRIAVGPRAGQKLFTLQTAPPQLQAQAPPSSGYLMTGERARAGTRDK